MVIKILIINFIYLFFAFSSAHAYLDPGTGSIIIQALLGFLAAVAVALKLYWHKFLRFLGIRKKINFDDENKTSEDQKNLDK